jgi:hypothetical protein
MPGEYKWEHPSSPARDLRWQAVKMLAAMLPRPYNYFSAVGRGMRKLRLEKELAEFDLLHRLRRGRPASLEQLVCAGMVLIASCRGRFPTRILPLEEALLINPDSFDLVAGWVEDRLSGVFPE